MENKTAMENEDVLTIDLMALLYLFRQKLLQIILVLLVGALVAGSYTYYMIPPTYQATSSLYIVSASNDSVVNLTDLQLGTSLTADYSELVLSRPMMESVIKNLGLNDVSPNGLKGMIRISNPSGTRILKITVTSVNPQQAVDIANEMAKLTVTWLPEVMESNTPNIVEDAILPAGQSSPNLTRNIALGAIIAVALYCGLLALRFILDDTIHTEEELERFFNIRPLAVLPEEQPVSNKKAHKKNKGGA